MIQKIAGVFVLITFLSNAYLYADVVKLKNGRTLEGAIIKQSKDMIVIDIGIGEAAINRKDIASVEKAKADNAAIYYLRAVNLANFAKPGDTKKIMEGAAKGGWKVEPKVAEKILAENKPCLDEMTKGLAIPACDFYFEDKYKYDIQKDYIEEPKQEIGYLHWLFLLKGRYLEGEKKFDEAADLYLSSLTYARQVAESSDVRFKAMAIFAESETLPLIKEYLSSQNPDAKTRNKILEYLKNYEKDRFSMKDYVKEAQEFYLSPLKQYSINVTRWIREQSKPNKDSIAKVSLFSQELLKQGNELSDKYFGNLMKAAESGRDDAWLAAVNECEAVIKDSEAAAIKDELDWDAFWHKTFNDPDEYAKRDPKSAATTILAVRLRFLRMDMDKYRANSGLLNSLKSMVKK